MIDFKVSLELVLRLFLFHKWEIYIFFNIKYVINLYYQQKDKIIARHFSLFQILSLHFNPLQSLKALFTYLNSEKEHQRHGDRSGADPPHPLAARPAGNTTLLARYCKDKVPRTCDHAILQNTSRPCSLGESFVSSGSTLTIEMRMVESTALRQV